MNIICSINKEFNVEKCSFLPPSLDHFHSHHSLFHVVAQGLRSYEVPPSLSIYPFTRNQTSTPDKLLSSEDRSFLPVQAGYS